MAAGDITAVRSKYSDFLCNVFDGVDDYVEIPHNANQLGANLSNGFTISAWINPRSYGETSGIILDKSEGAAGAVTNGFSFYHASTTKVSLRINAGTVKSSAANVVWGTWQHVLVTISSAQLANFYINGVLNGTANQDLVQGIAAITTTNAMRIGNRATATDRTFDGSIRSVKMWDRVLSATEIAEDYAGKKTATSSLILDVPLGGSYSNGTNSGSIATNTIQNKLLTDMNRINLPAATDKIIALPIEGRNDNFTIIGTARA